MTTPAAAAKAPAEITRYLAAESTEEMRERAAADRWQATVIESQIAALQRRAAQAEYEAALWIAAYDAEELMDTGLARGPGLLPQ